MSKVHNNLPSINNFRQDFNNFNSPENVYETDIPLKVSEKTRAEKESQLNIQFQAYKNALAAMESSFEEIQNSSLSLEDKKLAIAGLEYIAFQYSFLAISSNKDGFVSSFVDKTLKNLGIDTLDLNDDQDQIKDILTNAMKNIGRGIKVEPKQSRVEKLREVFEKSKKDPADDVLVRIGKIKSQISAKRSQNNLSEQQQSLGFVSNNPLFKIDTTPPVIIPRAFDPHNIVFTPQTHESFEIQRSKFLDAAKIFVKAAFVKVGRDNLGDGVDAWADNMIKHYEEMYSAGTDEDRRRFYHILSHALVQMLGDKAQNVLLAVNRILNNPEKPKDLNYQAALQFAIGAIKENPDLVNEVLNKLRHDAVQINGIGWQKDVMNLLKADNSIWTVGRLVNITEYRKSKDNQATAENFESLRQAGFDDSVEMQGFIELSARLFFPKGKSYNPDQSFTGFKKGGAEFVSAVSCYRREFVNNNLPNFAAQIEMIIFLRGTIPFEDKDAFQTIYKDTLGMLNDYEKVKLKNSFSKEFIEECVKHQIPDNKRIEYWIAKKVSEACNGANCDVVNFAKDFLSLYYGDQGVQSEAKKMGIHVLQLPLPERIEEIVKMIDAHRPTNGADGKKGFIYQNAEEAKIYHFFKSDYNHLNTFGEREVEQLHNNYRENAAIVTQMHQADLLQAVVELVFNETQSVDFRAMKPEQHKELGEFSQKVASFIRDFNTKLSVAKTPKEREELGTLSKHIKKNLGRNVDLGRLKNLVVNNEDLSNKKTSAGLRLMEKGLGKNVHQDISVSRFQAPVQSPTKG